jgi:hypothetical protein
MRRGQRIERNLKQASGAKTTWLSGCMLMLAGLVPHQPVRFVRARPSGIRSPCSSHNPHNQAAGAANDTISHCGR